MAMPNLIPLELWKQSGRLNTAGTEVLIIHLILDLTLYKLIRVVDRKGAGYCLGPTHEEVVVDIFRTFVQSYRQLPLKLYQISNEKLFDIFTEFKSNQISR